MKIEERSQKALFLPAIGVPQSDGGDYQVQPAGSITLIFEGTIADFAQSIEENRSCERVSGGPLTKWKVFR